MQALFTSQEMIWFILGIILLISEFAVPGVILVFFGVGAMITAFLTWIGILDSLGLQVLIFLISSLVLLFTMRKYLSKHFRGGIIKKGQEDAHKDLLGKNARVTSRITLDSIDGRVDLDGTEWKAISFETIEVGSIVEVEAKDNITLRVKPRVVKEEE